MEARGYGRQVWQAKASILAPSPQISKLLFLTCCDLNPEPFSRFEASQFLSFITFSW